MGTIARELPESAGVIMYCDHRVGIDRPMPFLVEIFDADTLVESPDEDEDVRPDFWLQHPAWAAVKPFIPDRAAGGIPAGLLCPAFELEYLEFGKDGRYLVVPGVCRWPIETKLTREAVGECGSLLTFGVGRAACGTLVYGLQRSGWASYCHAKKERVA